MQTSNPEIPATPSTQDYQTRKRDANKPAIPATSDKNDGQIRKRGTNRPLFAPALPI